MKISTGNLTALVHGKIISLYQRAKALTELKQLIRRVNDLERQLYEIESSND